VGVYVRFAQLVSGYKHGQQLFYQLSEAHASNSIINILSLTENSTSALLHSFDTARLRQ
jgi:hypothetical protein